MQKKIKSALISVYHKDGLDEIVKALIENNVTLYSTGGTQSFLESQGAKVNPVEDLTSYPSILGGRVKTLHPKVFGGILARRSNSADLAQLESYEIPEIDLVIVDLYPFEETVAAGGTDADIIEKIDIGGISLIRAAAKNFNDVLVVPSKNQYSMLLDLMQNHKGESSIEQRRLFAAHAFNVSSHYDTAIFRYFNTDHSIAAFKQSVNDSRGLRYGENPHQKALFYGRFDDMFEQLHGKEVSYNNLLDIDAAVNLIRDFSEPTFAILKHNNACGIACADTIKMAWDAAFASDPISAFGGVIIANRAIDTDAAKAINELFFEIIIAPDFNSESLNLLISKKNRIILKRNDIINNTKQFRSLLNGVLVQDKDIKTETIEDLKIATNKKPTSSEIEDLLFAAKNRSDRKSTL